MIPDWLTVPLAIGGVLWLAWWLFLLCGIPMPFKWMEQKR